MTVKATITNYEDAVLRMFQLETLFKTVRHATEREVLEIAVKINYKRVMKYRIRRDVRIKVKQSKMNKEYYHEKIRSFD